MRQPGLSRVTRLLGLAALGTTTAGCLPAPATEEAREVAALYTGFLVLSVLVGLLVFGLATFAVVRYRGRDDGSLPPQTHGNLKLEALWTALPVLTVLVLFGLTLVVLSRIEARAAQPATDLRVEAFRWGWTFRYPNEGIVVFGAGEPGPEVVVPIREPVRITVTAVDVNHAFFVPRFLFKKDAIPGRENVFEINVQEPGAYRGQCAEFCGVYHAFMPFTIHAVPRPEYEAWLAQQPREGAEASALLGSPLASPGTDASSSPSDPGQPLDSAP